MRRERDRGPAERPATRPSDDALDRGEQDRVAATCAAGAQQREVAPVALDGPERGQVGKPERDERARNGEHDVERLGVERVAGGGVEAVGRGCRRTRPGRGASARRGSGSGRRAPARAPGCRRARPGRPAPGPATACRSGRRGRPTAPAAERSSAAPARPCARMSQREDRDVRGRLRGRRAEQRVERLEEHVGRRDERDPAHAEPHRRARRVAASAHRVARLRLERRRELLVEDDLARAAASRAGSGRSGCGRR